MGNVDFCAPRGLGEEHVVSRLAQGEKGASVPSVGAGVGRKGQETGANPPSSP